MSSSIKSSHFLLTMGSFEETKNVLGGKVRPFEVESVIDVKVLVKLLLFNHQ